MTIQQRLITQDKLVTWGKLDRATCILCNKEHENIDLLGGLLLNILVQQKKKKREKDESTDHLFFNCNFSFSIWNIILEGCGCRYTKQVWETMLEELLKNGIPSLLGSPFAS